MTTPTPPRKTRPASYLVQHDIQLTRAPAEDERPRVVASVRCQRLECDVLVEACAHCARFARIETHEAGYVLLCRAHDEAADGDEPSEP
jgi:hypothetical protein